MNKRENIVQKFSTFLSFGDMHSGTLRDRQSLWQADAQLERQMKRLMQSDPEAKAEFWARSFLKILKNLSQDGCQEFNNFSKEKLCAHGNSIPVTCSTTLEISPAITARHLSAYLQEACLWAAQKSYRKYKFLRYKYPLEEYFQIASSFAHQPVKLLKSFNLDHPRSNIEGYAKTVLFRLIRDQIYQQDLEAKREKFSDYGLLRHLSNKELTEALLDHGIHPSKIDLYRLAWQCFNEIVLPQISFKNLNVEVPNLEKFCQISELYNQRLNQLNLLGEATNEETIQEMLNLCIKVVRNYRTKQFIPLEEYEHISDPTPAPLDIAIQQEERRQVQLIISKLFTTLPAPGKIMLILWHGLDLTQSEIATVIKSQYPELQKQYQVARHLARATKNILKEFVNHWNHVNPTYPIQDEHGLEIIKEALDECLQVHCQQFVNSILQKVIHEISLTDQLLLTTRKTNNNPSVRINEQKILRKKETLIKAFNSKLESELNLSQDALQLVNNKISIAILNRL
ncbi:conserved hypothetical protein [Planktothrix sp. PCC 11201]|uniref:sigma-70 family RNA polymerase sigma factor n=1 Tax=Planktothrix sp. PCC 11201 TaxID=1729650 RepID=UPI00091A42B8|nr:sigma-70 family RNA polymerase sigma factor [Planktothrix sp. PCC 11201]SKB13854.1 conserved hypothetical protein [Planktothrix sp. PCC 11201]